jgi:hypothetical protein
MKMPALPLAFPAQTVSLHRHLQASLGNPLGY